MVIRPFQPEDLPRLLNIVGRLSDYFTSDVPEKVTEGLRANAAWVILGDDGPIGFSIVERRSDSAAEILWMAVDPVHRGSGVGSQLLSSVIDCLRADGVCLVEVKTLDETSGYEPYVSTRAFWQNRGFVQIDTIDPLPGWQPGNPCGLFVASLTATR
jgi:GNAT superfamily N-acetyltransferase